MKPLDSIFILEPTITQTWMQLINQVGRLAGRLANSDSEPQPLDLP